MPDTNTPINPTKLMLKLMELVHTLPDQINTALAIIPLMTKITNNREKIPINFSKLMASSVVYMVLFTSQVDKYHMRTFLLYILLMCCVIPSVQAADPPRWQDLNMCLVSTDLMLRTQILANNNASAELMHATRLTLTNVLISMITVDQLPEVIMHFQQTQLTLISQLMQLEDTPLRQLAHQFRELTQSCVTLAQSYSGRNL